MHRNFARSHKGVNGRRPATAAGPTDHVSTVREIVGPLEEAEKMSTKPGSDKKRAA
jgi:hypothetical protein